MLLSCPVSGHLQQTTRKYCLKATYKATCVRLHRVLLVLSNRGPDPESASAKSFVHSAVTTIQAFITGNDIT
jgi:hypothetical protein